MRGDIDMQSNIKTAFWKEGKIGMTLEEMQEKKRKLGYSNEDLAK